MSGERVAVTSAATNRSSTRCYIGGPSALKIETTSGEPVVAKSIYDLMIGDGILEPGETAHYDDSWNQRDENGQVHPNSYRMTVIWGPAGSGVSEPFEIE